jgi:hypothetical protein
MAKDFLPDSEETSTSPASSQPPTPSNPEREPVQILVIGSKEGLSNIVHSRRERDAQMEEYYRQLDAEEQAK